MKLLAKLVVGWMICLLLAACGAKQPASVGVGIALQSESFKDRVDDVVEDKIRREKLFLLADDIGRVLSWLNGEFLAMQTQWESHPDMSEKDVRLLMTQFGQSRHKAMVAIARIKLKMRQETTQKEWEQIYAEENKIRTEPKDDKQPGRGGDQ